MPLRLAAFLGLLLLLSELPLAMLRRSSRSGAQAAPGGSHRFLWIVIAIAMVSAWQCALKRIGPGLSEYHAAALEDGAIAAFAVGALLRWWAIWRLGRFFTVDIATAADQQVVQDGPYRWMRHPSYTGLWLMFAGVALASNNALALAIVLALVTAALSVRINREEAVLREKLGAPYARYCARTRRLVPGVY